MELIRDPYENILIGNFFFSLGSRLGAECVQRERSVPIVLNLLQQTPLDPMLADAYAAFAHAVRVIEFKRYSNLSKKEKTRHRFLTHALAKPGGERLHRVSRTIHWYIESLPGEGSWSAKACAYLDMKDEGALSIPVEEFNEALVLAALEREQPEVPLEDIEAYFELLRTRAGDKKSSSSGAVIFVKQDGSLEWYPLENILDLRLTFHLLRDRANDAHRAAERVHENEPDYPELGRDGPELELERNRRDSR